MDKPNINVQESEKNCKTYCYLVINDSVETSHNRKFDKKRSQTELKNIIIMNNYNESNCGNMSNISRSSILNETKKESFKHQVKIQHSLTDYMIKSLYQL